MPISINGTGSITGLSAGGLPDNSIVTADIADSAVTTAKVNDAAITYGKLSTSATESDNVAKRTAKAWVNFNGTGTVAIQASYNVSSITDNGAGDYTINFASALEDSKYSAVFGGGSQTAGQGRVFMEQHDNVTRSTSQLRIYTSNASTLAATDTAVVSAFFSR